MTAMPGPQFTFRTLLWSMALVAAFLGGMSLQWQLDQPARIVHRGDRDLMILRDGSEWLMWLPPSDRSKKRPPVVSRP
jgi:hypothetical protein